MKLQENKAINLNISAPKINKIIIKPGETFSFWQLVGKISKKRGYLEGLTISIGKVGKDFGGGMCQFTNLIHWLVIHTQLTIVEHHHHNGLDMFPDFGRQVPFGMGTSISYNNVDYQFYNGTNRIYQLIIYTTDEYLSGEIRSNEPEDVKYHIEEDYSYFEKVNDIWYRNNQVSRRCVDKKTGNELSREIISTNHAKVLYDEQYIKEEHKKENINIKNLA